MLYRPLDRIAYQVSKEHDELIEACFVIAGFDREYIINNAGEFRREVYPEGRCIFYHNDDPLFTVIQTIEMNFEDSRVEVAHRVVFSDKVKEK